MDATSHAAKMDEALDRLRSVGFEFGPGFAAHAPMVAETLVTLGYHDLVDDWLERNKRKRHYYDPPPPFEPLPSDDPASWRAALGDFRRATDWVSFFERRLAERPWQDVLIQWWPRLIKGPFAAFTHGLIRTAHAVRTLRGSPEPSVLQRNELARALAYWASRYEPIPVAGGPDQPLLDPADVPAALSELTAEYAGRYAGYAPKPAVPLVHSVTAPAALRLVLPVLPPEMHPGAFAVARRLAEATWLVFPCAPSEDGPASDPEYLPPATSRLIPVAVETGDEHAIKFAEACHRENRLHPDPRYAAASHTLEFRYKRGGVH